MKFKSLLLVLSGGIFIFVMTNVDVFAAKAQKKMDLINYQATPPPIFKFDLSTPAPKPSSTPTPRSIFTSTPRISPSGEISPSPKLSPPVSPSPQISPTPTQTSTTTPTPTPTPTLTSTITPQAQISGE